MMALEARKSGRELNRISTCHGPWLVTQSSDDKSSRLRQTKRGSWMVRFSVLA